jgi:5-methylcytosine-specific restriction endonuclease McrA
MSDTLILNANGKPLSLNPLSAVHWHISVKLMFLEKAKPLDYYNDWHIHSPSLTMRVPSIMILNKYYKQAKEPKFSRSNVHLRDLFTCQYCGCEVEYNDATLDHVVPRSKGGASAWNNIVTACSPCNVKKGSQKLRPSRLPYKPHYYELENKRRRYPIVISTINWNNYLNWPENLIKVA